MIGCDQVGGEEDEEDDGRVKPIVPRARIFIDSKFSRQASYVGTTPNQLASESIVGSAVCIRREEARNLVAAVSFYVRHVAFSRPQNPPFLRPVPRQTPGVIRGKSVQIPRNQHPLACSHFACTRLSRISMESRGEGAALDL